MSDRQSALQQKCNHNGQCFTATKPHLVLCPFKRIIHKKNLKKIFQKGDLRKHHIWVMYYV